MSVINDMLRDLDARKAPERAAAVAGSVGDIVEPASAWRFPWVPTVVIALVVALLVAAYWYVANKEDKTIASANDNVRKESQVSTTMVLPPQPIEAATAIEHKEPLTQTVTVQAAVVEPEQSTVMVDKQIDEATKVEQKVSAGAEISEQPQPRIQVDKVTKTAKTQTLEPQPVEPKQESVPRNNEPVSIGNESRQEPAVKALTLSPQARDQENANTARKLFMQGQEEKAFRQLYDYLAMHDVDELSRALLAGQLMQRGRFAEAGDLLLSANTDNNADLRQLKARWYAQRGQMDLALHALRKKLPLISAYPDYYALLASYYQQMGYPVQASKIYGDLVAYDADVADWWAGLAIALDAQTQYDSARTAYLRALQLPGLNPQLMQFAEQRVALLNP